MATKLRYDDSSDKTGTLAKALDIMEVVVGQNYPTSASEVSTILGLAKPTGHRVVGTLRDLGYLKREPESQRLIEGDRLVSLALDVLAAAARRGPRHSILQALAEETGETCNLGCPVSGQVVYVDRVETKWPLGLRFEPGSHVPIHCTALGKMFLGFMSQRLRQKYLSTLPLTRYTENTITDADQLREELDRIRDEGVAVDDQEFMSGVVCIGVPIRGPSGRVAAGVAISAPEARLTTDEARQHIGALQEAARKLALTFDQPAAGRGRAASRVSVSG